MPTLRATNQLISLGKIVHDSPTKATPHLSDLRLRMSSQSDGKAALAIVWDPRSQIARRREPENAPSNSLYAAASPILARTLPMETNAMSTRPSSPESSDPPGITS